MAVIHVLIVDDHPVIRAGIRDLIKKEPDLILVGEASNGQDALRLIQDQFPDVVLLDISLPDMSGVDVVKELKQMNSPARVLAFSAYSDQYYISEALKTGIAGYLVKDESEEMIVTAIRGIAQGEQGWISRQAIAAASAWVGNQDEDHGSLSNRENQILEQITIGKTNREIAYHLGISVKTVEKHIRSIFIKLNASSRTEAAVKGTRLQMTIDQEKTGGT